VPGGTTTGDVIVVSNVGGSSGPGTIFTVPDMAPVVAPPTPTPTA
jgi:hypothetical protein